MSSCGRNFQTKLLRSESEFKSVYVVAIMGSNRTTSFPGSQKIVGCDNMALLLLKAISSKIAVVAVSTCNIALICLNDRPKLLLVNVTLISS